MNLRSIVWTLTCIAVCVTAVTAAAGETGMTVVRDAHNGLVATMFRSASGGAAGGALAFEYHRQCDDYKPCFTFSGPTVDAPACQVVNSPEAPVGSANCPAAGVKSITLVIKTQGAVTVTKGPSGECSPVSVTVEIRHDNVAAQLKNGCTETVVCGTGYKVVSMEVDATDDLGASCKQYFVQRG